MRDTGFIPAIIALGGGLLLLSSLIWSDHIVTAKCKTAKPIVINDVTYRCIVEHDPHGDET